MTEQEWRKSMGDLVHAAEQSEVRKRFYAMKFTTARAAVELTQIALFIQHRRDCWANVSANCPHLSVKQKILQHEYEEIIRDEYSEYGHLDLTFKQARSIGLSPEDVLNTAPLPSTRAALYGWGWITREKSWFEGLAALMATEMCSDNRLLADLGGGASLKKAKKWLEELGATWEQIPDSAAHSKADEKHSEMFLSSLAEFVSRDQERLALQAVKESLELREVMTGGICDAMAKLS
jgi:pyrroloquinoline quinone (PQQ) biosynthesis protein C